MKESLDGHNIEAFIWCCMEMFYQEQFQGKSYGKNDEDMFRLSDIRAFVRDLIELKKMGLKETDKDEKTVEELEAWIKDVNSTKTKKGKTL